MTGPGILGVVRQRLTRRVRKLVDAGAVATELLVAAGHEAELLRHPYVGVEHLELGRLATEGREADRAALRAKLTQGVRRRRWRPRGPRSALRGRGLRQTESRRLTAEREEQKRAET